MAFGLFTEDIVDGCDSETLGIHNIVSIEAVFEPVSFTCLSGQYLPINTVGCVTCPNEATCSGGTYTFNEVKNQGIIYNNPISQNKPNGCISNLLGTSNIVSIEAVFEPVAVSLNFDDRNGHVINSTCTYDGLVNLPPTPTREGYDFVGWKLETNNN